MRRTVAVLAAVATLGVAGPVAVSAANAADAPETDAASCQIQHNDDKTLSTVTFCNPDGTLIQTVSNKAADAVRFSTFAAGPVANVEAANPGKTVDHWAYTGSTEAVDPDLPVYADIAVYPVLKDKPAVEYVYVYFHDKGTDDAAPLPVVKGSTWAQVKGEAPTVKPGEGKVLAGWSADGQRPVLQDADAIDASVHLYPVIEDAPAAQATVTFNGISAATGYKKAVTLEAGSKLSAYIDRVSGLLPTPPAGYELAYYTVSDKGEKTRIYPSDPVRQDVTVSVEYAAQTVKVTFYMDENSAEVFGDKKGEDAVKGVTTLGELAARIGEPTRPGKVFVGWTGVGTDVLGSNTTFDRDTALTASWKDAAVNHTVTFNDWANWDGKVSFNDGKTHRFHEYQDALKYEVQVPKGYDFAGWSEDANHKDVDHLVDSLKEVTADMQVYPVFVKNASETPAPVKVNVAFHDNQGNVIANIDGTSGDTFDAFTAKLAARNITAPAVPGQEFVAWSVKGGAATPELVTGDLDVYPAYKATPKPQPQYPWWAGWWGGFQHWWGSWNQWFGGWWR